MGQSEIQRLYKSSLAGLFGAGIGFWLGAAVKATILDFFFPITAVTGKYISSTEAGVGAALITGSIFAYFAYDESK